MAPILRCLEKAMKIRVNNGLCLGAILLLLLGRMDLCLGECKVQLKPYFLQPTVKHLELFPGNSTTLICEVHRNLTSCDLSPGQQPNSGLEIWWCNSTDPACHNKQQTSYDPLYLQKDESKADNASYLTSTLRLMELGESQKGQYYCVAYSQDDFTTGTPGSVAVFVDVRVKSPVKITKQTEAMELYEGSPFNLSCTFDGYPTPSIRWEKDNNPVNGRENGTFYVKNATFKDTGMYVCIASNDFNTVKSEGISVKVNKNLNGKDVEWSKIVPLIIAAVVCVIILILIIRQLRKNWSNEECCTTHHTNIIGNNNQSIHATHVTVITSPRGTQPNSGHRASTHHERRSFLHLHDVFIHNHSSDVQFAELIRSKLQDRESHLNVGLWSEVERPDRQSSRNKLLRLRLLNCSRIVLITSEEYLKHTYHAFTSAVAKSRVSQESIRGKMIVIRLLEERVVPRNLTQDLMASLDYNVETDSCYFWPKFFKVAIPDQTEILYWS